MQTGGPFICYLSSSEIAQNSVTTMCQAAVASVSTSYVERQNLTMHMGVRRFTRLTNAFSKEIENHLHMLSLYFFFYNWCRPHKSLHGCTPAMEAGLTQTFVTLEGLVGMIDAPAPVPMKPGPKPRTYRPRKGK